MQHAGGHHAAVIWGPLLILRRRPPLHRERCQAGQAGQRVQAKQQQRGNRGPPVRAEHLAFRHHRQRRELRQLRANDLGSGVEGSVVDGGRRLGGWGG